jgi:hypothetical protein
LLRSSWWRSSRARAASGLHKAEEMQWEGRKEDKVEKEKEEEENEE